MGTQTECPKLADHEPELISLDEAVQRLLDEAVRAHALERLRKALVAFRDATQAADAFERARLPSGISAAELSAALRIGGADASGIVDAADKWLQDYEETDGFTSD